MRLDGARRRAARGRGGDARFDRAEALGGRFDERDAGAVVGGIEALGGNGSEADAGAGGAGGPLEDLGVADHGKARRAAKMRRAPSSARMKMNGSTGTSNRPSMKSPPIFATWIR